MVNNDHISRVVQSHDKCSPALCMANQIDEDSYETCHARKGCACEHFGFDINTVIQAMKEDTVPVYNGSCLNDNDVNLVSEKPYVAISHVWSDGLGNPVANTMPRYQLARTSHYVTSLSNATNKHSRFWIDTLCCPIEPREARRLAISQMKEIYQGADSVLVLDSDLLVHSSYEASPLELLMRIYCAKWNRRLWTLQEGLLAVESLFFQFADKAINILDLCAELTHEDSAVGRCLGLDSFGLDSKFHLFLLHLANLLIIDFYGFTGSVNAPISRFSRLQRLLHFRTTSVAKDEALCLGSLLGVDVRDILHKSEASSCTYMQIFWSLVDDIPPNTIFYEAERLQIKGLGWAPVSFIGGESGGHTDLATATLQAHLTAAGLLVNFSGIILDF